MPTIPQASSRPSPRPLSASRGLLCQPDPCSRTRGRRGRRSVWPLLLDTAERCVFGRVPCLAQWLAQVPSPSPVGAHRGCCQRLATTRKAASRSRLGLPGHTFPVSGLNVQEWNGRVTWQVCAHHAVSGVCPAEYAGPAPPRPRARGRLLNLGRLMGQCQATVLSSALASDPRCWETWVHGPVLSALPSGHSVTAARPAPRQGPGPVREQLAHAVAAGGPSRSGGPASLPHPRRFFHVAVSV